MKVPSGESSVHRRQNGGNGSEMEIKKQNKKSPLVCGMDAACWLENNLDVLLDPILQPGWIQKSLPGRENQC